MRRTYPNLAMSGRVAAVCALAALAVLAATRSGGDLSREAVAGEEETSPWEVALPLVTEAGVMPAKRLDVWMDADLVIRLGNDDTPLGLLALRSSLAEAARPSRDGVASSLDLVLHVDRSVPWPFATYLLQTAADPRVRIWRTWFAVEVPDAGCGALAVFLPRDRGLSPKSEAAPSVTRRKVKLLGRDEGQASSIDALYHALRGEAGDGAASTVVTLVTPPPRAFGLTTGVVLRAIDATLRAGVAGVYLEGHGPAWLERDAELAQLGSRPVPLDQRARPLVPHIRVDNGEYLQSELEPGLAPLRVAGLRSTPVGSDLGGLGLHDAALFDQAEEPEALVDEEIVPDDDPAGPPR